jgi:hypothetical protein
MIFMKTLFCAVATVLFGLTSLQATTIQLSGKASWTYNDPDCTFTLNGALTNPTAEISGSIKLVLWISAVPFPSSGSSIAELGLGQISGGGQIGSFSTNAPINIPKVTGDYYFTILVMEYTTLGWQTRTYVDTGKRHVENGTLASDSTWVIPDKAVGTPPSKLNSGDHFTLKLKATADLSALPAIYQVKTQINAGATNTADVIIMGNKTPAIRTYSVVTDSLNGKSVKAGKLFLDYQKAAGSGPASNSTMTLYFQGTGSGVYKHVSVNPSRGGTTWGTFTYR